MFVLCVCVCACVLRLCVCVGGYVCVLCMCCAGEGVVMRWRTLGLPSSTSVDPRRIIWFWGIQTQSNVLSLSTAIMVDKAPHQMAATMMVFRIVLDLFMPTHVFVLQNR